MTIDEAIDIAWGIDKFHGGPRPTPQAALEHIDRQVATCGFNWLTGQEAQRVLREACKQPVTLEKSMAKTTLTVEVTYDGRVSDPESLASAADRLMETVLSTPGIVAEYGNPRFGEFFVLHADSSQTLHRWVLYDLDSESLLSTRVYDDYDQAVEDAERANDILVLSLPICGIVMVEPREDTA